MLKNIPIIRMFFLNIGFFGEDEAVIFLKKKRYSILERNVRNAYGYSLGEIDIVAKKDKKLIFVEVKTRVCRDKEVLPPEMSITQQKLRKIERVIFQYRIKHNQYKKWPFRLDAIIVVYSKDGKVISIQQKENIFLH